MGQKSFASIREQNIMKNTNIYTFKVDFESGKILDDNDFVSFVTKVFPLGDFKIHITDKSGKGFTLINEVVNYFLDDCRKEKENRLLANPYRDPSQIGAWMAEFIENYLNYYFHMGDMFGDDNYYALEIFKKSFCFKAYFPKDVLSEEVYDYLAHLGPQELLTFYEINDGKIFKYILPGFIHYLHYDELEKDPEYNHFEGFKIGIA